MRMILVILLVAPFTLGANILGLSPIPARSHNFLFHRFMIGLANAGHNVTFVAPYLTGKTVANLKEIKLPFNNEKLLSMLPSADLFKMRDQSIIETLMFLPAMGYMLAEKQLESKEVQDLLKSDSKFDVIIGAAFNTESVNAVFQHRFKAPLIGYSPTSSTTQTNLMIGNIAPTATVPNVFLGYPVKMTFYQRMKNFLFDIISTAFHQLYTLPKYDQLYRKYAGEDAPPLQSLIFNTSLMLVNDHFALTFPRPATPNQISIGGVHVNPPKKLPEDLQKYLDESKDGAILFSMGSNLKSSNMPQEKINIFLNTFSKLKQNVLWKFETDLPNKPRNVLISDWLPQSDILAHPNIKLFITHGGGLSTTESVDRGVPVLGIPIFGDQPTNMRQSVNAGVGLSLQYDEITTESFHAAIREILDNPKYTNAAKKRSELLKDLPVKPLDAAIFWTEYVIRHKGAPHLRSTAQDLRWYEAEQLDVIVFLVTILYISLYVVKKILGCVFSKLCGTKKPKVSTNKKNK